MFEKMFIWLLKRKAARYETQNQTLKQVLLRISLERWRTAQKCLSRSGTAPTGKRTPKT